MKVAYVNSVAGFGSTGRIVWQLASLPDVQGKIYYGRKENKTDAETYRITGKIGNGFVFFSAVVDLPLHIRK